jgi:N6-adenosine-specific RNA methylase IME4
MSYIAPDLFKPQRHVAWPFGGLAPQAYGLIMADPPWRFEAYSELGEEKGPAPHYDMMDDADILALPVGDLAAADCLLWLWATGPRLDLAIATVAAWGFEFKSAGAWDKQRWGTGYLWRSVAEFVLLGTRGSPRVNGAGVPNIIRGGRGAHSAKPDAAYLMAEQMMPRARRASLFDRPVRSGWEGWGDQYGQAPGRRKPRRERACDESGPLLAAMGT